MLFKGVIIVYDIIIIGAGVVGANVARELSKYKLNICILEKQDDVSCGASKANSGIVHGGYDDKPGTLKAKLCIQGNKMYEQLERELNFGYRKTGSLVIAFSDEEKRGLVELYEQGVENGIKDLEIIDGDKVRELEPYISNEVKWALYCKHSGVCSPYEFCIALVENAIQNGVELKLNNEVKSVEKKQGYFEVITSKEKLKGRYVINAAGVYSDKISQMVGVENFYIIPRRGEYILFNKDQSY